MRSSAVALAHPAGRSVSGASTGDMLQRMNTRTIAILALIIAVIVLLIILL